MSQHKFKVGQPVDYMPDKLQTAVPAGVKIKTRE